MQRSARTSGFAFPIEHVSNLECVRVEFDQGVYCRATIINPRLVDFVNSRQIFLNQRPRGKSAGFQSILQFWNRDLLQFERLYVWRDRPNRRSYYSRCTQGRIQGGRSAGGESNLQELAARRSRV